MRTTALGAVSSRFDDDSDDDDHWSVRKRARGTQQSWDHQHHQVAAAADFEYPRRGDMNAETAWSGMRGRAMPDTLSGEVKTNSFGQFSGVDAGFTSEQVNDPKGHMTTNVPRPITLAVASSGNPDTDKAAALMHHITFMVRSEKAHAGALDVSASLGFMASLADIKCLPTLMAWINSANGKDVISDSSPRFQQYIRCFGTMYESENRDRITGEVSDGSLESVAITTTRVGQQKCHNYWICDKRSQIDGTHLWLLFKYGVNPLAADDYLANGSGRFGDARVKVGWYCVPMCTETRTPPFGAEETVYNFHENLFDLFLATDGRDAKAVDVTFERDPSLQRSQVHPGVRIYIGEVLTQGGNASKPWPDKQHYVDSLINPAPGEQSASQIVASARMLPTVSVLFGVNDMPARNKVALRGGPKSLAGDNETYSLFAKGADGAISIDALDKLLTSLDLNNGDDYELSASGKKAVVAEIKSQNAAVAAGPPVAPASAAASAAAAAAPAPRPPATSAADVKHSRDARGGGGGSRGGNSKAGAAAGTSSSLARPLASISSITTTTGDVDDDEDDDGSAAAGAASRPGASAGSAGSAAMAAANDAAIAAAAAGDSAGSAAPASAASSRRK